VIEQGEVIIALSKTKHRE